ncbi:MAG: hypothetical protein ACRYG7_11695 [Janthinobacterium lividum]
MNFEEQKLIYDKSMPKGEDFIKWVFSKDSQKEEITSKIYMEDSDFQSNETYKVISEFFQVIYKVSTCGYGCKGGPHVIEYIAGRGYNLGLSSLKLIRIGFYDEALSLIRNISEIVNLFALFAINPVSLSEWYDMTEKERMREFSPFKVRQKLEETNLQTPVSKEYYSKLCEVGVHFNPSTKPQGKNHIDRALVGSIVFKEQAIAILNDLANNLCWLAIMSLRNSVDKGDFIRELDVLEPLFEKIGELSLESLDEYLNKKKQAGSDETW